MSREWTNVRPQLSEKEQADQEVLALMSHAYTLYMEGDPVGARLAAQLAAPAVPVSGPAQAELGRRLLAIDHPEAAETALRKACDLGAADEETLCRLAASLEAQGNLDEAADRLRQTLILNPSRADAYLRLGVILGVQRRSISAMATLRQAVHLDPLNGDIRLLLAQTARRFGNMAVATKALMEAYLLAPGNAAICAVMGESQFEQGDTKTALKILVRASRLAPGDPHLLSRCLELRHAMPGQTPALLATVHRAWQSRFGSPVPPPPFPQHQAGTPLRIGLISPDLGDTRVGWLVLPLLRHRDPKRLHVTLLSDGIHTDPVAQALRKHADAWADTLGQPDDRVARIVRDAAIDVLIDLAGHSQGNRMTLFARQRPAAIQATWAGYPGTTGLKAMDLMISDPLLVCDEEDTHMAERVIRIGLGAVTLDPIGVGDPPEQAAAPQRPRSKVIILGAFAEPSQINDVTLDIWARTLQAIPGAHLLLKSRHWSDPGATAHVRAAAEARGIDPAKLLVEKAPSRRDLRATLAHIHVLLDAFPHSCDLTTLEALAHGVPVVTLAGTTPASRLAAAQLTRAGRLEGIATNPDDYVRAVLQALKQPRVPAVAPDPVAWTAAFTDALEAAVGDIIESTLADADEDAFML